MYQYTYYCLGCNRKYESDVYYPYGWICKHCYNKTKLTIKCSSCGKDIQISWETYRKNKYNVSFCKCEECNNRYQSKLGTERWKNKSEEEKQIYSDEYKQRWNDKSSEEKKKYSEYGKSLWINLSEEEKHKRISSLQKANKKLLENLSKEELITRMQNLWNGRDSKFKKETLEEREIRIKNHQDGWNRMSNENKIKCTDARVNGFNKYINNYSYDNFIQDSLNEAIKWNSDLSKHLKTETNTEEIFKNILDKYKICNIPQYYNIEIHPNFKQLFPYNPIFDTENISPFHKWDFLIQLIPNHKIFIDVDGSIHDPKQFKYKSIVINSKEFDDSQRLYQTDNNQAYVILAYNDKIDNKTLVLDLKTGFKFSFNSFIDILLRDKKKLEELHKILDKGD